MRMFLVILATISLTGCMPVIFGAAAGSTVALAKDRSVGVAVDDVKISSGIKKDFISKGFRDLYAKIDVQGRFFGARDSTCSCDPCDCNPCSCGDARQPDLPAWRVSGCFIESGTVGEIDLSRLVLLSLAQPRAEDPLRLNASILQQLPPSE